MRIRVHASAPPSIYDHAQAMDYARQRMSGCWLKLPVRERLIEQPGAELA